MTTKPRQAFNPESFLAKVGKGRSIDTYHKGQVIFAQGGRGDRVFYLQSGRVKSTIIANNGKEAIVAIMGTGQFFGEKCLAGYARRMSTAETLTECVIVRLDKTVILHLIHQQPAFADMVITRLLDRTIRIEADLTDHLCNSSEKRLARLLLLLAGIDKKRKRKSIIAKVDQQTLAAMIGTTRSRVSFFMNKFRKLGLIGYDGSIENGIEVHASLLNVVLQG